MKKYRYIYKNSNGERRDGVMEASSRDAVFVELRKIKIRPIKVIALDGSKDNGAVYGVRKRIVVYAMIVVALVAGVLAYFVGKSAPKNVQEDFITSKQRRQIVGDAGIIEKGIATGWDSVFDEEGERFFASFAIPGVPAGLRNTTDDEIKLALGRKIMATADDTLEARQIKAIVEGMKDELRNFLAADKKRTIVDYGKRLVERQEREIAYYRRAKEAIERAQQEGMAQDELLMLWEERNEELRRIGVRLVPIPE